MEDTGNVQLYGRAVPVLPQAFARLLYANPVCLLTTHLGEGSLGELEHKSPKLEGAPSNVMTISWLTATTNVMGGFLMSMNCSRHTAKIIRETKRFVLNVPVRGMEETVRRIGRSSGGDQDSSDVPSALSELEADSSMSQVNSIDMAKNSENNSEVEQDQDSRYRSKFERVGLKVCRPGWSPLPVEHSMSHLNTLSEKSFMEKESKLETSPSKLAALSSESVDESITEHQAKRVCMQPRQTKGNKNNASGASGMSLITRTPSLLEAKKASDEHGDIALTDCIAHLVCRVAHILDVPTNSKTAEATAGDNSMLDREVGKLTTSTNIVEDSKRLENTKEYSVLPNSAEQYFSQVGTPLHMTLFCFVELAFVREKYWAANNFAPREMHLPPYLCFFGGGTFGYAASRDQLRDEVLGGETERAIEEIQAKKRMKAQAIQAQKREEAKAQSAKGKNQLQQKQKQKQTQPNAFNDNPHSQEEESKKDVRIEST